MKVLSSEFHLNVQLSIYDGFFLTFEFSNHSHKKNYNLLATV